LRQRALAPDGANPPRLRMSRFQGELVKAFGQHRGLFEQPVQHWPTRRALPRFPDTGVAPVVLAGVRTQEGRWPHKAPGRGARWLQLAASARRSQCATHRSWLRS